jgi:hypothetical protein
MNDEAIAHHGAVIDQMTWGHRFINETFGPEALPTVGWQIDAFGHSAGYTSLTAAMGMKAAIGQKIDYQDQARRRTAHELEFVWRPDSLNQPNATVFTHIMWDNTGGYSFVLPQKDKAAEGPNQFGITIPLRDGNCTGGPPGGNGCCTRSCGSNCDSCAVQLALDGQPGDKTHIASRVAMMVDRYRKGAEHVLFAFGSDFQFQDAPAPFQAMEEAMRYVKAHPEKYSFELVYSTPADYFSAIGAPGFVNRTKEEEEEEEEVAAVNSDWPTQNDGDFLCVRRLD